MSNTYTDANGYTYFKKGTMKQLMTPNFMLFILLSQVVFTALQTIAPTVGGLISIILYAVWFTLDRGELQRNEAFVPSAWWFLFIPVYIYKRQNRNGNSRLWLLWYFLTFIPAFLVSIIIAVAMENGHY